MTGFFVLFTWKKGTKFAVSSSLSLVPCVQAIVGKESLKDKDRSSNSWKSGFDSKKAWTVCCLAGKGAFRYCSRASVAGNKELDIMVCVRWLFAKMLANEDKQFYGWKENRSKKRRLA